MKKLVILSLCAMVLAGCNFKSKDLKAENDSLYNELALLHSEVNDMMKTFNEIQEGFRQINAVENRVDLQRGMIGEKADAREQIVSDIEFITRQMEENRVQIAKLQAQVKSGKTQSAELKKAVEALQVELNAKQERIEELQKELASKNVRIQELDNAITEL